jgi:hypothetical protein
MITLKKRVIGAVIGVSALAGGIGVAACGSSAPPAPTGFHNMNTLQNSVEQQSDQKLAQNGSGEVVTGVTCVLTSPNVASCAIQGTGGDSTNITVAIAANGNSWVETSNNG